MNVIQINKWLSKVNTIKYVCSDLEICPAHWDFFQKKYCCLIISEPSLKISLEIFASKSLFSADTEYLIRSMTKCNDQRNFDNAEQTTYVKNNCNIKLIM